MTKQLVVRNYRYLLRHNAEERISHDDRNITRKQTAGIHIQITKKPSDTACTRCDNKTFFGN
jgi:hypothetical protein